MMITTVPNSVQNTKDTLRWLYGRGWIYQLLIDFFENEPALSLLIPWQEQLLMRDEMLLTEGGQQLKTYFTGMGVDQVVQACREETAEYDRLFRSEDAVLPRICESVYRFVSEPDIQDCLRDIRRTYAECGIVFNKCAKETDDHITIELEFMAVIGERTLLGVQLREAKQWYLNQQIGFLKEHLLAWTPLLAEEMLSVVRTPLYKALAQILKEFIPHDLQMLQVWKNKIFEQ